MKRPNFSHPALFRTVLAITLCITTWLSIRYGAVDVTLNEIFSAFKNYFSRTELDSLNERIIMTIRIPRALLCIFVGATLSVGGVLLQALFRNPIIEPGLIGTSSGAAFGAALYFVLGTTFQWHAGTWTLPVAACLGAILSTSLVFLLAPATEKNQTITLLLVGIAINALFMSGVGFLSYLARDPQARSITFWGMGSLAGASWNSVFIVGSVTVTGIILALCYAKHLNALRLGEDEAWFLGVQIKHLKYIILLINIVMVSVATAFVGVISFVGLITPHLLRILTGSGHRYLILNAALLGGILLSVADIMARLLCAPAELPIGILTSVVGVPIFIILLRQKKYPV